MLGAVCHDLGKPPTTAFIDGRIRSLDHEAGGRRAGHGAARSPQHPHDRRLRRPARRCSGIVAHHLKPGMFRKSPTPVGDGAFRRLAQKVDLELLARVAKADCLGRGRPGAVFDCSAMDWFLERARELGVEHAPPAPILKGRHLLALGMAPGPDVAASSNRCTSVSSTGRSRPSKTGSTSPGRSSRAGRPAPPP